MAIIVRKFSYHTKRMAKSSGRDNSMIPVQEDQIWCNRGTPKYAPRPKTQFATNWPDFSSPRLQANQLPAGLYSGVVRLYDIVNCFFFLFSPPAVVTTDAFDNVAITVLVLSKEVF